MCEILHSLTMVGKENDKKDLIGEILPLTKSLVSPSFPLHLQYFINHILIYWSRVYMPVLEEFGLVKLLVTIYWLELLVLGG